MKARPPCAPSAGRLARPSVLVALVFAGLGLLVSSAPARAQLTEFCQFTGNPGPCGPFDHYDNGIGQDLRITLVLGRQGGTTTQPPAAATPGPPRAKLNTIRDVFGALRTCFAGATLADTTRELAATIRFSFTRSGDILGEPRFTYVEPGLPADTKQAFEHAIGHALVACAPLSFTDGLGGALAGRPFSIRIVKPAKQPTRS